MRTIVDYGIDLGMTHMVDWMLSGKLDMPFLVVHGAIHAGTFLMPSKYDHEIDLAGVAVYLIATRGLSLKNAGVTLTHWASHKVAGMLMM